MADKKEMLVEIRKAKDDRIGAMRHTLKSIKGGTKADFIDGKLNTISTGGDTVMYADGYVANSVTLKGGTTVSYETDFNGQEQAIVRDKDGKDITNTAEGKKAMSSALKAVIRADGFLNVVAKDRNIAASKNFDGLRSWAKHAQEHFEARQKVASARQKLLMANTKGYANAEIAIAAGASVEEVNKARKKDERVAADKATKRARANQKIREEQRQESAQRIIDRDAAYRRALAEQRGD